MNRCDCTLPRRADCAKRGYPEGCFFVERREHPTLDEALKLIAWLRQTEPGGNWHIRCNEFGPYGPPYSVEGEAIWGEPPEQH